jgi:hypothetical protein
MFEIMSESAGNILGVRATGKLTDEDYKNTFLPKLASVLKEHDSANLLLFCDEGFEGWTPKAMWDDAYFGWIHRNDFNKMAVVSPPAYVDWCMKLSKHFMKGEIKTFTSDQLSEAWAWLRE